MKVSYSSLNSKGGGNLSERKIKVLFLLPIVILAVFFGFMLELFTVERLNLFLRIPLARISNFQRPNLDTEQKGNQPLRQFLKYQTEANILSIKDLSGASPLWEKHFLLNISNFHWLRNNVSICQLDKRHPKARLLPIMVHSARSHFSERLTIRKSWGSLLHYKKWSIRLIFLIGEADRGLDPSKSKVNFSEQETLLDNEQSMFGDLVQGSFVDSYRNLTYKHIMGYKWILNFCSNASFVLKADDDMFVDVMRFLNWRSEDLKTNLSHALSNLPSSVLIPELYCTTFVGMRPQRCVGCKWYVSETEWPLDYYPDYCSGSCYGITVDLIRKLYSVLEKVNFFWVDDVFIGILLEEVKKTNPGFEPQYKHLWNQMKVQDFKNFRPMCEHHDVAMKRKFGAVVPIPRGTNFERDMMCLWNKTVYDDDLNEKQSI